VLRKHKPSKTVKTLEKRYLYENRLYNQKMGIHFDAKKIVIDDVSKEQI
jgi:hypothetical protein